MTNCNKRLTEMNAIIVNDLLEFQSMTPKVFLTKSISDQKVHVFLSAKADVNTFVVARISSKSGYPKFETVVSSYRISSCTYIMIHVSS